MPLKGNRMRTNTNLPSLDELKAQAKRLRVSLDGTSPPISHSQSLEHVAHLYGYRDWNTLFASAGNQAGSCPYSVGQPIKGRYLGQAFTGQLTGVSSMGPDGSYRLSFTADEPVDVVTFDSFSSLRQRISCVVDRDGKSREKTSDGTRHLELD